MFDVELPKSNAPSKSFNMRVLRVLHIVAAFVSITQTFVRKFRSAVGSPDEAADDGAGRGGCAKGS